MKKKKAVEAGTETNKANAKKMDESAASSVKALVPSAGISATIKVKDGRLKIKTEGRPSGQMAYGRHGDHVTAQILSAHGIRRAANGIEIAKIDDLRNARGSIFDFISSIAILNGTKSQAIRAASASAASEDINEGLLTNQGYVVNLKARDGLYERVSQILDEYNLERYKQTKLAVLEKVWGKATTVGLSEADVSLINESGGLKNFFHEYLQQNKASNRRLICDTFARLIEVTSTYYYQIPNTAFPIISGYEASASEGGNVNAALSRLDAICVRIEEEKKIEKDSSLLRRSSTIKTLYDVARESAREELDSKGKELESLNDNPSRKKDEDRKIRILPGQIEKLAPCIVSGNNPLQYIALKLKNLFHYPEIGESISAIAKGNRTNDPEEFYNQVARHLFIVFNVYPELAQNLREKAEITKLFLYEVINHRTDLREEQGWPSLQYIDIKEHLDTVNLRLAELDSVKSDNLYTSTEGYRSRASSGAIDREKEEIIGPAMNYIRSNFGLVEEEINSLKTRLEELTLDANEAEFRKMAMKCVLDYCRSFDVDPEKMQILQRILLSDKAQERKMGGVL